jgi:uncharacterized membrane protein
MSRPDLERAMRTLAGMAGSPAPLPDADTVWELAAVREQWRLREMATRPIRLAEAAGCVACSAAGVAAFLTLLPGIQAALSAADQTLVRLGGMTVAVAAAVGLTLIKALLAQE